MGDCKLYTFNPYQFSLTHDVSSDGFTSPPEERGNFTKDRNPFPSLDSNNQFANIITPGDISLLNNATASTDPEILSNQTHIKLLHLDNLGSGNEIALNHTDVVRNKSGNNSPYMSPKKTRHLSKKESHIVNDMNGVNLKKTAAKRDTPRIEDVAAMSGTRRDQCRQRDPKRPLGSEGSSDDSGNSSGADGADGAAASSHYSPCVSSEGTSEGGGPVHRTASRRRRRPRKLPEIPTDAPRKSVATLLRVRSLAEELFAADPSLGPSPGPGAGHPPASDICVNNGCCQCGAPPALLVQDLGSPEQIEPGSVDYMSGGFYAHGTGQDHFIVARKCSTCLCGPGDNRAPEEDEPPVTAYKDGDSESSLSSSSSSPTPPVATTSATATTETGPPAAKTPTVESPDTTTNCDSPQQLTLSFKTLKTSQTDDAFIDDDLVSSSSSSHTSHRTLSDDIDISFDTTARPRQALLTSNNSFLKQDSSSGDDTRRVGVNGAEGGQLRDVRKAPPSPVPIEDLDEGDATHRGCHKFMPRHPDELFIEIGDPLYVDLEDEDLWCRGVNLRTGKQGIFPAAYATDLSILEEGEIKPTRFPCVKFLGSVEVNYHKGTDVLSQAISKVVQSQRLSMHSAPPPICRMEINEFGIKMTDKTKKPAKPQSPEKLSVKERLLKMLSKGRDKQDNNHFFALKNISYCGCHPRDDRYFAFITKHPVDMRFACHVFESVQSTKPMAEAVGASFKKFFQEYMAFVHPTEDIYLE